MAQPLYVVDAFSDRCFAGNPAAVVLLDAPRDPAWMQRVAAEMNLSETAFPVRIADDRYALRWFTPTNEVPLCGHATLATAAVLLEERVVDSSRVTFETASGPLHVERVAPLRFSMSLPAYGSVAVESKALIDALATTPLAVRVSQNKKLIVEVASIDEVTKLAPRADALLAADNPHGVVGVVVTSRGDGKPFDFVSRFFAPWLGILEDPVTGAAHCALGPYWRERLGKSTMRAAQRSPRGGELDVDVSDDRVTLGGACAFVSRGALLA